MPNALHISLELDRIRYWIEDVSAKNSIEATELANGLRLRSSRKRIDCPTG